MATAQANVTYFEIIADRITEAIKLEAQALLDETMQKFRRDLDFRLRRAIGSVAIDASNLIKKDFGIGAKFSIDLT